VHRLFEELSRKLVATENQLSAIIFNQDDLNAFSFQVASVLPVKTENKAKILETRTLTGRLRLLRKVILAEIDRINLDEKLDREVEKQIEKAQKEYYLTEKMKMIKKELGRDDNSSDVDFLKQKIDEANMPESAKEKAIAELKRLELMPTNFC